jgi:hypothetical protein
MGCGLRWGGLSLVLPVWWAVFLAATARNTPALIRAGSCSFVVELNCHGSASPRLCGDSKDAMNPGLPLAGSESGAPGMAASVCDRGFNGGIYRQDAGISMAGLMSKIRQARRLLGKIPAAPCGAPGGWRGGRGVRHAGLLDPKRRSNPRRRKFITWQPIPSQGRMTR